MVNWNNSKEVRVYMKKYRKRPENKKRAKKHDKEYYLKNKEEINKNKKIKYATDKDYREKIIQRSMEYKKNFPEKRKEQEKRYRQSKKGKASKKRDKTKNKAYYKDYGKKYRQTDDYKKRLSIKNSKRIKEDLNYAIKKRLRNSLLRALKTYTETGKIMKSRKYGIEFKAIMEHLKPFPKDLSKYHIDHIRPLCSFDLTNPEEVKKAFSPENHQWLLIFDNISKGGKYVQP